ncbi:hypothetical protein MPNT_40106 [Candidatus Methylacidithermus pantelleriae]|uniref:Uncharacterized protein n=1 Tax=Candidatus Methylacidithermus pantelleriae TaxID=2744239 RepID=A0A8J2BUB6_9BACT|nr:hypothetical protein MPNT_40106 [Candidatus Methylacidithermus pantelleriae]
MIDRTLERRQLVRISEGTPLGYARWGAQRGFVWEILESSSFWEGTRQGGRRLFSLLRVPKGFSRIPLLRDRGEGKACRSDKKG